MQKNQIICFYLILFISCVISDCPSAFEREYRIGCSSDLIDGNILQGTLEISIDQIAFQHTLSPKPLFSYVGGYLVYDLVPGVNYTLTVVNQKNSGCNIVEYLYVPNHKFEVTLPKCKYSQGKIQFVPAAGTNTSTITSDCWDKPCVGVGSQIVSFDDSATECYAGFNIPLIEVISGITPNIKVKESYCYKNTGTLDLLNKQDYTSWKLTKANDNSVVPETSAASGSWSQLASIDSQSYSLELKSEQCDTQVLSIDIAISWPSYRLEFGKNDSCPLNSPIKIHFDDPNIYQDVKVKLGDVLVTSEDQSINVPHPTKLDLSYYVDATCHTIVGITYPFVISDVQYSIDMCSGLNPVVTLHYDETQYPDIIISINGEDEPTYIAEKTFEINHLDVVLLESSCFFTPMMILAEELRVPTYTMIRAPKYCGDTMDFMVTNYYLFEELAVGVGINHDGHGFFKNISPSDNVIYSRLNECQVKSNDVTIDYPTVGYNDIEPIVEIINLPTCLAASRGLATFRIRDTKNNIESEPSYFHFESDTTYSLSTSFTGCTDGFIHSWKSPLAIDYKLRNITDIITVQRNTDCYYNTMGYISINATLVGAFHSISVESVGPIQPTTNVANILVFDGLPYGQQTINIHGSCTIQADIFVPSSSDWVFPATVTPVTGDCSNENGKITYDSSLFSFITPVGNFVDVPSGFYDIDFILQNNSCSGIARIYVPTTPQPNIEYSVIQEPSCQHANDGTISVTLKDSNNQQWSPSKMSNSQGYDLIYSGSLYSSLEGGDHNIVVYNDSCSWPLKVTLAEQDPQLQYQRLMDTMEGCTQKTFTKFYSNNYNIKISSVSTIDRDIEQFPYHVYRYPSSFKPSSKFWVAYNNRCFKTIDVESKSVDMVEQIQWPTSVTIENNDCSDPSAQGSLVKAVNPGNLQLYFGNNFFANKFYTDDSLNPFSLTARDRFTGCTRIYEGRKDNRPSPKVVKKSTCPGSYDGTIQTTYDKTKDKYSVMSRGLTFSDSEFAFVSTMNGTANLYNNIDSGSYIILRSPKNNPFCQLIDQFDVTIQEPTVHLSSTGICDASDSAIGDTGVITNTLSITTSNVTYNINGVVSNNPVFKGLPVGDYSSIVTIYNNVCQRVINSNTASVSQLPSLSVVVDTSTCMNAVINPSRSNIQHQFVIKDSTGTTVSYGERTGSFSFIASAKDTYSISISDMSNTCLFKTSFNIAECSSTDTPTPSSSIKLSTSSLFYIYCIFLFVFAIFRI